MTGPRRSGTAVPFSVPAPFLVVAPWALVTAAATLLWRPSLALGYVGAPGLLATVHLITLGFAAMVLVGALHQLVPVLVNAPLRASALSGATFAVFAAGVSAIVVGFARGFDVPWLAVGGTVVLVALIALTVNVFATALASARMGASGHAVVASAAYLTTTALLGTLVALARVRPELAPAFAFATPLHVGLGFAGAFGLALVGAGHKLLGMFVLAHGVGDGRVRVATWAVHAAMALLALAAFARWPLVPVAFLALAVAAIAYLDDVHRTLRRRVRRRVETPIATYVTGVAFVPVALALGASGRWHAAVAALLTGFVALAIAGMLVKIASFLAWQHRFAPKVGREPVPMVRDLTRPALEPWTLAGLVGGALALAASFVWPSAALVRVGAALQVVGATTLALHVAWIVLAPARPVAPAEAGALAMEGVR
ncbi:MAG: hypothetical protein P1P87_00830 [Trueperaceae bacterium]|nr:hypothetical protein [Trueperaceae bacterium]